MARPRKNQDDKPRAAAGNNVSDATIAEFMKRAALAKRIADEAAKKYKAELKIAKSAGVDPKWLTRALALRRREPEDVIAELRGTFRALNVVNYTIEQTDLFRPLDQTITAKVAEEMDTFTAEELGYAAGRRGDMRDANPYAGGTILAVSWDNGWRMGQAAIADEMGPQRQFADARRSRRRATAEEPTEESLVENVGVDAEEGAKDSGDALDLGPIGGGSGPEDEPELEPEVVEAVEQVAAAEQEQPRRRGRPRKADAPAPAPVTTRGRKLRLAAVEPAGRA